jgi:hypothetical protein
MYKNDIDEMYPRESFPVVTPSPKTSASNGYAQPLSKVIRLPNLNDWSKEQEETWLKKDMIEVERYYLNTHNNIKKMKKSPKGKPTLLIAKKKEWRQGLGTLLVTNVPGYKLVHTPRETSSSVVNSATTALTMLSNSNETPPTPTIANVSVRPSGGKTLGIRRIRPMPVPIKKRVVEEPESDWHVDYNHE